MANWSLVNGSARARAAFCLCMRCASVFDSPRIVKYMLGEKNKNQNALNAENGSSFSFPFMTATRLNGMFERRHRLVRSILKSKLTLSFARCRFFLTGFFLLLSSLVGNNKYQVFNGQNYTIIKEKRL